MKKFTIWGAALLLLTAVVFTPACGGDDDKCVTEAMSFKTDILPILTDAGCTGSACHNGTAEPDDYRTYAGFKVQVDANRVLGSIKQEAGFSKMPKGGSKLSDCNISKIEAWITQGAKDN